MGITLINDQKKHDEAVSAATRIIKKVADIAGEQMCPATCSTISEILCYKFPTLAGLATQLKCNYMYEGSDECATPSSQATR